MLPTRMWLSDFVDSNGDRILSDGSSADKATEQDWFTAMQEMGESDNATGVVFNFTGEAIRNVTEAFGHLASNGTGDATVLCQAFIEIDVEGGQEPVVNWACRGPKEEGEEMEVVCEGTRREH